MLVAVKDAVQNHLQQGINHVIVTKYDQPDDCIGWHNDKEKTITHDSVIAVISLGKCSVMRLVTTHLIYCVMCRCFTKISDSRDSV